MTKKQLTPEVFLGEGEGRGVERLFCNCVVVCGWLGMGSITRCIN
jgi:hypothetical protein